LKGERVKYVKVALNLPLYRSFYYGVPRELAVRIKKGKQVLVPFRSRNLIGFVIEEIEKGRFKGAKLVRRVIDDFPPLNDNFLYLGEWISKYYCCPLGQVLFSFLPAPKTFKIDEEEKTPEPDFFYLPQNLNLRYFKGEQCSVEGEMRSISPSMILSEIKNIPQKGVFLFQVEEEEKKIALCLYLISKILKENKQIIFIVPEVNYLDSLKKVILTKIGEKASIFHSKLSPRERYKEWERIRKGKTNLIMGTRSVVFSPLNRSGLIIIEEEENLAYKQIEAPRYHTREVAIERGRREGFAVILFSNAPSLESWYKVKRGDYKLIKIQDKKENSPRIKIVDMRKEKDYIFSVPLKLAITQNLKEKRLILLFLNRRGFANFLLCKECGRVIRCPNCNIGLSFHLRKNLRCHYCNYQETVPLVCPFCGGNHLYRMGIGTEQIEMKIRKMFPKAHIRRVDVDVINSSSSYKKFLDDFIKGEINLLIGTQLAIKKEILQKISLVGVVSADISLNLPDFRATEWTFQFLNKVRTFIKKEGEVIIQTYNPDHYVLKTLERGDKEDFYEREMEIRKELNYPPYLHWVRVLLEGKIKEKVKEIAEEINKKLKKEKVNFLGPCPCPFSRIKGKYRYHLILKNKNSLEIEGILKRNVIPLFNKFRGVRITIDVDPLRTM